MAQPGKIFSRSPPSTNQNILVTNQKGQAAGYCSDTAAALEIASANGIATATMKTGLTLTDTTPNNSILAGGGTGIGLRGQTSFGNTTIAEFGQRLLGPHCRQFVFYVTLTAGSFAPGMVLNSSGNVGIGTTTPYSRLEVFGPDAASSTSAFAVVNTSSSTVFAVFDGGNAQLSGTLTQSSDQRLKTNIQVLDGSSSLAEINALNPVTFNWIDPNQDDRPQLGFLAQQVQGIFPSLVSTTSPTALTPDGTLGLNYIDLISPIVAAIQELDREITLLASTVAGFAQSITTQSTSAVNATMSCRHCRGHRLRHQAQLAALLAAANQSAARPLPHRLRHRTRPTPRP